MRFTNAQNLPAPLFNAIADDRHGYDVPIDYSVTQLLKPVQMQILQALYDDEIVEDAMDGLWRTFGKVMHVVLEDHAPEDWHTEVRCTAQFQDRKIGGTIDAVELSPDQDTAVLHDWKITSAWSVVFGGGSRDDWVAQLNLYRWLYEQETERHVTGLKLQIILRDWQRNEARRNADYPRQPFLTLEVPMWSNHEVERFLEARLQCLTIAEAEVHAVLSGNLQRDPRAGLPQCTAEECWAKPDTWAVKKQGRKSAVRVLASRDDALAYAQDQDMLEPGSAPPMFRSPFFLEHRKGLSVRCKDYCPARAFCLQRQAEIDDQALDQPAE